MFDVKILGASAAVPTPKRGLSSVVVEREKCSYLFDCGEGTQMQMMKYGVKGGKIDHIFISHLHVDHYLGLVGLLFSYSLLGRTKPIRIYAPNGIEEMINVHLRLAESVFTYPITFITTSDSGLNLLYEDNDVEIHSFPLNHKIQTTGFILKEKSGLLNIDKQFIEIEKPDFEQIKAIKKGNDYIKKDGTTIPNKSITTPPRPAQSFAYCSDTAFDPSIANHIKGVNILYHEATFGDDMETLATERMHSTAKQAATIASIANVGTLIIGHLSARYKDSSILIDEAKTIFPNVVMAYEGDCHRTD